MGGAGERWELIHLLARVDGNERTEPALLDHLYGQQADALLSEGWRRVSIQGVAS